MYIITFTQQQCVHSPPCTKRVCRGQPWLTCPTLQSSSHGTGVARNGGWHGYRAYCICTYRPLLVRVWVALSGCLYSPSPVADGMYMFYFLIVSWHPLIHSGPCTPSFTTEAKQPPHAHKTAICTHQPHTHQLQRSTANPCSNQPTTPQQQHRTFMIDAHNSRQHHISGSPNPCHDLSTSMIKLNQS